MIMPKNSFISFLSIVFIIIFSFSCEKKEKNNCPSFSGIVSFTYSDPVCHPSGKIICFNHYPIKEIKYTYGLDCPDQAHYIYDQELRGFWLMDKDGQNKRRALPYFLNDPSWSPDGKFITFTIPYIGIIYKMPFDGEHFDTSAIVRLTDSERNFFPTWSPSGKIIAYDNSLCPAECGIYIMDTAGNNRELIIKQRRSPFWGRNDDTIYYNLRYFDLISRTEHVIVNDSLTGFTIGPRCLFNPQKNKIFFTGINTSIIPRTRKLYSINYSGRNFRKVSDDPILNFTFTPDGKIIYHLYDSKQIDEVKNTLWIMDQDGSNNHQLTNNNFITSF
jgi:TolB protein